MLVHFFELRKKETKSIPYQEAISTECENLVKLLIRTLFRRFFT